MRIGIFTECYLPTLNGVVVSIETFRKELEMRGHKFFIFAPANKKRQGDENNVCRYPSFNWPGQGHYPIAFPVLSAASTVKRAGNLKLDIIHTQHLFSIGKLGLRVGRRLGIPVVHTYHTLIAEYTHYVPLFSGISRGIIIGMSRRYCNACDEVITPSPSMKKVLLSYGVRTPIEPIPTGVDLGVFKSHFDKEVLRTKWHILENKKILLYVSRIAKEKNLDFLFGAIQKLSLKRQDFHLLMVGGGPELGNFQNKVKELGLETLVTFTDMQEKTVANRFFGAADIFVFPSITETQGIVITEAMAAGIPAVAVGIMGPTDLIKDGVDGYLTSFNNYEFSAKIEKLLDDENLRKQMGEKAREGVKKFSTQNCALRMEELYAKAIRAASHNSRSK